MSRLVITRGLAILGGGGLIATGLFLAWYTALAVIVSGGGPPDPFARTGDPCCGTPDSWAEVAPIVATSLVGVALTSLVLAEGAILLVRGWRCRRPRRRWLFGPAVAATGLGAILWAALLLPALGKTPELADCATFALRAGDWRSVAPHERVTMADGIDRCGALDGRSTMQVRALLGAPDRRQRDDPGTAAWDSGTASWDYDDVGDTGGVVGYTLTVRFRHGRVVAAFGPDPQFVEPND